MSQDNKQAIKSKDVKDAEKNQKKDVKKEDLQEMMSKLARQYSQELLTGTVIKAVKIAEIQKKYPPLPENLTKLSEPKKAAYISLYKRHRDVLQPKTVSNIKRKIADYLE